MVNRFLLASLIVKTVMEISFQVTGVELLGIPLALCLYKKVKLTTGQHLMLRMSDNK